MAFSIDNFFWQLESMGVYRYLLPFLLIFVLLFAILEKTKIFGQDANGKTKTNINIIFSLIVSGIVIMNPETRVVETINDYLPGMSMFIVFAIMFMLIIAMLSKTEDGEPFKGVPFFIALIVALIAVFVSLGSSTYGANFPFWFYVPDWFWPLIIFVGIIIAIIAMLKRN